MKIAGFVVFLVTGILAETSKIDPGLKRILLAKGHANVFVTFHEGTRKVLDSFDDTIFTSRPQKLTSLKNALVQNAKLSQNEVVQVLNNYFPFAKYQQFWITNQVYISRANLEMVEKISRIPLVSSIEEEVIAEINMPIVHEISEGKKNDGNEPGIDLIQAPDAWGLDGGNNGENVVIATIDTGVRGTHEALRNNFYGQYGWFDPYSHTKEPNDKNGHGTHTTGTIAGHGGIGVAPGAKWMSCKGCRFISCSYSKLIECGEFMLCPTDPQGKNADCAHAPHLVSNSWGGGQGNTIYQPVIDAWVKAGIIPIFSNGNSGPDCGSASSPADYIDAIGVGSTTLQDEMSSFSSKGPSIKGHVKPDISAPGSSIRSAYHLSDTAYSVLSGTSMAGPHAAGVAALLKGRDQALDITSVKKHLYSGATTTTLVSPGLNCGDIPETQFPNNAFGHGRVNAFESLMSLLHEIEE